jgi:hypothetical protein
VHKDFVFLPARPDAMSPACPYWMPDPGKRIEGTLWCK